MKVVILAGGFGTRLSEETELKPKPMVNIGEKPILWHLMKTFSIQGYKDFVIALGYKSEVIKRWLLDLERLSGDIEVNTQSRIVRHLDSIDELGWQVTAIETGLKSQTGSRIRKCMDYFPGERVLITYGDGLANINVHKLLKFHTSMGRLATITAVKPPARFGHLEIENDRVKYFGEKNNSDVGWINGGYFVLEPETRQFFGENDFESFESDVLPKIVEAQQLSAYTHTGFWQPMDTLREKNLLETLANSDRVPWYEIS